MFALMNDERLIDLEIKFAHQEMALEELQKAVYDQNAVIDRLEKTVKLLKGKLNAIERGDGAPPVNEKPPHY
jgi:SlyX protein